MPEDDLKSRLEKFVAEAAECDLIGQLSTDDAKRLAFRQRAAELKRIAEAVKAGIVEQRSSDARFLQAKAAECRALAATLTDADIRTQLVALAAEMEKRAAEEQGQ